jgi:hypothetical protein
MAEYRGKSRVEYLAHKPEIEELLNRGYATVFVYRQLSGEGKITMSLTRFYALVRYGGTKPRSGGTVRRGRKNPVRVSRQQEHFIHDVNADAKDLL